MPLRIGFDMDGVIADFASAYRDVEVRLFGPEHPTRPDDPEKEEEHQQSLVSGHKSSVASPKSPVHDPQAPVPSVPKRTAREQRRRHDAIWAAIRATPDFWAGLAPLDPTAVRRIHELMLKHRWEVFFITQRPATDGDTVQRQTQRWLVEQGFDLPSVLVLSGSRGAAAGAIKLDYLVDDSPQNCLDTLADSRAKPLLIVPDDDAATVASARKLGIGVTPSIGKALDILDRATTARSQPGLLEKLAALVGWR